MCPALHRKPYPSDVSDEEWSLVVPYLTLMTEAAPQREHSLALAQDLRAVLRVAGGREPDPTAAIIDSRTLRSTPESGTRAGYDGAKRKRGSKVHLAVDTLCHLLALHVTPADVGELARIESLSGAGLDLFRVLRGEKPLKSTYSRQNVSASLRHKLHEDRGQLSKASYLAGHIVPMLAWVYWGSIEAWVTGRPGRTCLPKRHWQQRANQVAALRVPNPTLPVFLESDAPDTFKTEVQAIRGQLARFDTLDEAGLLETDSMLRNWAETHPGEPFPHATLNAAGLHALATTLKAAALAALAAELGPERNLKKRLNGYWTKATLTEVYAALCRTHGITFSSSALVAIGGDG